MNIVDIPKVLARLKEGGQPRARNMAVNTRNHRLALWHFREGGGINPHIHERADELFYFLEGEGVFTVGIDTQPVGPGQIVNGPAGVVHSFETTGEGPWSFMTITSPNLPQGDVSWVE